MQFEQNKNRNKITLITEITHTTANSTFQLDDIINSINVDIQGFRCNLLEIIKTNSLDHIETQNISTYNSLIHNFQTI